MSRIPQTYEEALNEVLPLFREDPDRFMPFYRAVNNLLASIPEGGVLRIADHCKPSSIDLFVKIATLHIMEDMMHCEDPYAGGLEFSEDYSEIKHSPRFIPAKPWKHPRSKD